MSAPYIEVPGLIRWQDGVWSGEALRSIETAALSYPDGLIPQSPTGPLWPLSGGVGAWLLLWEALPFLTLAEVETNVTVPALENVAGRVYGPL